MSKRIVAGMKISQYVEERDNNHNVYTRLVRKARKWTYKDKVTLEQIYKDLQKLSETLGQRRVEFIAYMPSQVSAACPTDGSLTDR